MSFSTRSCVSYLRILGYVLGMTRSGLFSRDLEVRVTRYLLFPKYHQYNYSHSIVNLWYNLSSLVLSVMCSMLAIVTIFTLNNSSLIFSYSWNLKQRNLKNFEPNNCVIFLLKIVCCKWHATVFMRTFITNCEINCPHFVFRHERFKFAF